jgi:hypothetical protein
MSSKLMEVAYHEAGHALLNLLYGRRIEAVTVRPGERGRGHFDGRYLGYCSSSVLPDAEIMLSDQEKDERQIQILFAGAIAEMIGTKPGWSPEMGWSPSEVPGAGSDMKMAAYPLKARARALLNHSLSSLVPDTKVETELKAHEETITARLVAETYMMLTRPLNLKALQVLAEILYWSGSLRGTVVERILKDALNLDTCSCAWELLVQDVACEGWEAMVNLGGYYSLQARGWLVPPSEWRHALKVRDRHRKPMIGQGPQ